MAASQDPVAYLRSLPAIRERTSRVFSIAQQAQGGLQYFSYHPEKEAAVIDYCAQIIARDFGTNYAAIPPHGRWRHFDVGGLPRITTLLAQWHGGRPSTASVESSASTNAAPTVPPIEAARRLVDLFTVSVLLDAGAGTKWTYEETTTGFRVGRSEGLALASLDMFKNGVFAGPDAPTPASPLPTASSSSQAQAQATDSASASASTARHRVTAAGLRNLSFDTLAINMQVHPETNPMTGIEGRGSLLTRLGDVLANDTNGYFVGPPGGEGEQSPENRRPGYLVGECRMLIIQHDRMHSSHPSACARAALLLYATNRLPSLPLVNGPPARRRR